MCLIIRSWLYVFFQVLLIDKVGRSDGGMYQCLVRGQEIQDVAMASSQLVLGGKYFRCLENVLLDPTEEWTLPRPFFDHFRLDMIGNISI